MKKLMIIGAGGHGRVVADIARLNGYDDICFLDDGDVVMSGGYRVIGKSIDFKKYIDYDFIVAIGNSGIREEIFGVIIASGGNLVSLVHPNSIVGENVVIGMGTVVMAGVVINSNAEIGKGVIINTCSSVDHDCVVGDFSHVSVGAHLCGTVSVGNHTWVGAGATVINNVTICSDCMIGAGAVVVKSIDIGGTYVGVPAKKQLV